MPKDSSFSSKFKSFFSNGKTTSPPKPDLSNTPSEFQKAYEASKNPPHVPEVPLYVFSASIEDNLKSLTDRINDLEEQLNWCKSLSLGKYIDHDTVERLYQCIDRLECAWEESILIREGILPSDSRPLLSPCFTDKELVIFPLIVNQLHEKHFSIRAISMGLAINRYLQSKQPSKGRSFRDLEENLELLKKEEDSTKSAFIRMVAPHYGSPADRSPNSFHKMTGNVVIDYASLDTVRQNFARRSREVEQKLQNMDTDSPELVSSSIEGLCLGYFTSSLQFDILQAISPDGCPSPSPDLSPESLRAAQSLIDEIYSNILQVYKLNVYIHSTESDIESQKRKDEVQSQIDKANSIIRLASEKLNKIYNP